jgi:hypothetical protein
MTLLLLHGFSLVNLLGILLITLLLQVAVLAGHHKAVVVGQVVYWLHLFLYLLVRRTPLLLGLAAQGQQIMQSMAVVVQILFFHLLPRQLVVVVGLHLAKLHLLVHRVVLVVVALQQVVLVGLQHLVKVMLVVLVVCQTAVEVVAQAQLVWREQQRLRAVLAHQIQSLAHR